MGYCMAFSFWCSHIITLGYLSPLFLPSLLVLFLPEQFLLSCHMYFIIFFETGSHVTLNFLCGNWGRRQMSGPPASTPGCWDYGLCHHTWLTRCWASLTQGPVHARQALYQWGYIPANEIDFSSDADWFIFTNIRRISHKLLGLLISPQTNPCLISPQLPL